MTVGHGWVRQRQPCRADRVADRPGDGAYRPDRIPWCRRPVPRADSIHSEGKVAVAVDDGNSTGMRRKAGVAMLAVAAAGATIVMGVGLPSASAEDRVETIEGNPDCQDLGYANEFKIEASGEFPEEGTYAPGDEGTESKGDTTGFSVEITYTDDDPITFDFEATIAVDAVLVKAGTGATAYIYEPPTTTGEGLESPKDDSISHITFCWDTDTTTTTVPGSTTTTGPTTTMPGVTTTTPGGTTTVPGGPTTTTPDEGEAPTPPAAAPVVESPDYAG
jgi:hypothetical protein